ncbi:MAG: hypothetical protein ABW185_29905 [Sedimenticola sp.]
MLNGWGWGWTRGLVVNALGSESCGPSWVPGTEVSEMLYSVSRPTEAAGCYWFYPEQPGQDVRFYLGPAHRAWGIARN